MLRDFLAQGDFLFQQKCDNWRAAIDAGAAPLLRRGIIEPSYVQAIKQAHQELPYMVIAPGIMLAHARPEQGAHGVGLTLMTLAHPIAFGNERNDPVRLVITLATPDATSHVQMLETLMGFLTAEGKVQGLLGAKNYAEATQVLGA